MTIKNKDEIIAELEAELKKYKDMAAKGLEEFKDVGGCWGCCLQLQLNQDLEDIKHLKAENERLKEKKSKLLSKCIDKQCRINELINIVSTKEFTLKVNGKKYEGLNGIDKAKLFINNENAVRDNYIKKLENKISELQYKFYENCKKVVEAQKQIEKYKQTLQEIKDIIKNDFENKYLQLGFRDYDEILESIKNKITKAEEE